MTEDSDEDAASTGADEAGPAASRPETSPPPTEAVSQVEAPEVPTLPDGAPVRISAMFPGALLFVFAVLIWQVRVDGPLLSYDRSTRFHVQSWRWTDPPAGLEQLAQWGADLGEAAFAVPVLLLAAVYAAWQTRASAEWRRWWMPLVLGCGTVAAIVATVLPGKLLIGRPGPTGWPLTPGQLGYFPSGHTTVSAVCYGAALLLLLPYVPSRPVRVALTSVACLICLAVGAGLVWCDYHWMVDVLGAWCLSGVLLWCVARARTWLRREQAGAGVVTDGASPGAVPRD